MKHTLFMLPLFPFLAFSQPRKISLISNQSSLVDPNTINSIRDIYINSAGNKVVLVFGSHKQKIPIDSVWGYTPKDLIPRRVYRGKVFKILQADTLSIYERNVTVYKGRKRQKYFSTGQNGEIHKLNGAELKTVFKGSNDRFLNLIKKELTWTEYYDAKDKGSEKYKIVNIFKQSIGY